MNAEKFSKIASGIQAVAVTVAVMIGGGWTLYTFGSLQQVAKAEAEVEKDRADVERARRDLVRRGYLVITLRPSQMKSADPSTRYVLVDVEVLNKGNSPEVFYRDSSGLNIAKVDADVSGGLAFGQTLKMNYPSFSILPNQTRTLPFLVRIVRPGVWFIEFAARVMDREQNIHSQEHLAGASDTEKEQLEKANYAWGAATYFSVE